MATVACMTATPLGLAINLRMATWGLGDAVFGIMVWLSIGLIALGFVPGLRKWRWGGLATNVSVILLMSYMAYVLWYVVSR